MDYTPKAQWDYIYQTVPVSQIPWETGMPSRDLVALLKKYSLKKGIKVLDVGCGLGTQTRYLARHGAAPTGIDISETAIKKAREQSLKEDVHTKFVVGDVCRMLLPTASFEVVYDRGCYHHLNPKQRRDYVKEVTRVLSKGGMLHMLVFAGTISPSEVITYFLPHFQVLGAYEDTEIDHTNNNQPLQVHILDFTKLS